MPRILLKTMLSTLPAAILAVWPALSFAQDSDAVTCDDATSRCTSQISLVAENGDRISTFGIQIGKDGSDPVVFATTPLGSAIAAGIQLVIGTSEIRMAFEICLKDGCRATKALTKEELDLMIAASDAELRILRFGIATPIALKLELPVVVEALKQNVQLP